MSRGNQAEVRQLILAGLAEHWGELDESLNPELDDMVSSYADGRTVLVRNAAGVLAGTGTLLRRNSEVAEITRMSVASTCRRQGIGREILGELVATARSWNVEVVVLETETSWTDAVSFYQGCGFSITGVEPGNFGGATWFELRLREPRGDEQASGDS